MRMCNVWSGCSMRLPCEAGNQAPPYGQSGVPAGGALQPDAEKSARNPSEIPAISAPRECRSRALFSASRAENKARIRRNFKRYSTHVLRRLSLLIATPPPGNCGLSLCGSANTGRLVRGPIVRAQDIVESETAASERQKSNAQTRDRSL